MKETKVWSLGQEDPLEKGMATLSNTLATSCEELTHWKRPWYREGLGAGGEGDDRGWGGWMASPTRWTWAWINSRSWWWTGRPGVLDSWGRRVGHDWATELNWTLSNILVWKIPWTEESGGIQSMGLDMTERLSIHTAYFRFNLFKNFGSLNHWDTQIPKYFNKNHTPANEIHS